MINSPPLPGGAAVAETYLPEPGPALAHGYHRTNDLMELSNGLVFLRDRAGDQINVAAGKFSPKPSSGGDSRTRKPSNVSASACRARTRSAPTASWPAWRQRYLDR